MTLMLMALLTITEHSKGKGLAVCLNSSSKQGVVKSQTEHNLPFSIQDKELH